MFIGILSFLRIQTDIGHLNHFQEDLVLILNADRDAYQAIVSEQEALEARSKEELDALKLSRLCLQPVLQLPLDQLLQPL